MQPVTTSRAAAAAFLVLGHLEDGVDRLLLRLVDEGAGVDHQHVGGRGIARQLMPRLLREPEHDLGVHKVLRTAEGDHSNFHVYPAGG